MLIIYVDVSNSEVLENLLKQIEVDYSNHPNAVTNEFFLQSDYLTCFFQWFIGQVRKSPKLLQDWYNLLYLKDSNCKAGKFYEERPDGIYRPSVPIANFVQKPYAKNRPASLHPLTHEQYALGKEWLEQNKDYLKAILFLEIGLIAYSEMIHERLGADKILARNAKFGSTLNEYGATIGMHAWYDEAKGIREGIAKSLSSHFQSYDTLNGRIAKCPLRNGLAGLMRTRFVHDENDTIISNYDPNQPDAFFQSAIQLLSQDGVELSGKPLVTITAGCPFHQAVG
jgi:hypothetical protein